MRRAVDWLFRNRETGQITIWQWPNAPLWAFVAFRLVGWGLLATIALVIWAGLEVWRGVNPFRRILGGLVLVAVLAGLILR